MKTIGIIAYMVFVLSTYSASAADLLDVKQYSAMRTQNSANVTLSQLKANPGAYSGKMVEIRGRVSGVCEREQGGLLIIDTQNEGSFVIQADPIPVRQPGADIACLVRVGTGGTGSVPICTLAAWVYSTQLQDVEQSQSQNAKEKDAQEQPSAATSTTNPSRTIHRSDDRPISRSKADRSSGVILSVEQLVRVYRDAIKGFNSKLSDSDADKIARSVLGFSAKYKVDPRLVCAVILAESHFRIDATSRCGAQGLGQLMPSTAAGLGVDDAYDPVKNIQGSTRYIRSMLDRMTGKSDWNDLTWNDLGLAIAAYNAGPNAVKKHGGVPPYKETQAYVKRVTSIYKQLCGME